MGYMEKVGNDTHIHADPFVFSLGLSGELEVFNKLREALPGKPAEALDKVESAYKANDKSSLSIEYHNFLGIMLSPNININIDNVSFKWILALSAIILSRMSC